MRLFIPLSPAVYVTSQTQNLEMFGSQNEHKTSRVFYRRLCKTANYFIEPETIRKVRSCNFWVISWVNLERISGETQKSINLVIKIFKMKGKWILQCKHRDEANLWKTYVDAAFSRRFTQKVWSIKKCNSKISHRKQNNMNNQQEVICWDYRDNIILSVHKCFRQRFEDAMERKHSQRWKV